MVCLIIIWKIVIETSFSKSQMSDFLRRTYLDIETHNLGHMRCSPCFRADLKKKVGIFFKAMEEINDYVETVKPLTPRSAIQEGKCQSDGVSCGLWIYYTHWSSLCSGPWRFPRAPVFGFRLLSVFPLAVLIGLTVYCQSVFIFKLMSF